MRGPILTAGVVALAVVAYAPQGKRQEALIDAIDVAAWLRQPVFNIKPEDIERVLSRDESETIAVYVDPPPHNGFAPPAVFAGPRAVAIGRPERGKVPVQSADLKSWIGQGDAQHWILTPSPARGSPSPVCWYEAWMTRSCAFGERW